MRSVFLTGDLHLTDRPAEEYRWAVWDWLAARADRYGVDTLILLGDVTDRKDHHPARLVNRLADQLAALPFRQIYWLVGNHDFADPTEPFFRWARFLPAVSFIHEPTQVEDWMLLPNTADPVTAWSKIKFRGIRNIGMHQPAHGALTSNGFRLDLGEDTLIQFLRQKAPKSNIYSGDIHVPQVLGPITYIGSPHPVHFNDVFRPRVGLVDEGTGKFRSLVRRCISRRTVTIDSVDELDDVDLSSGDHIRVQLRLPRSEFGAWDTLRQEVAARVESHGAVLFGTSMHAADAKEPGGTAATQATSRQSPKETIQAFLATRDDADSGLFDVGVDLFQAARAGSKDAVRKPGDLNFGSVEIEWFKSYKARQVLSLADPGLFNLSGRNILEPRLGANGTGKTSIPDALCWCLWGRTPRGTYGPSIVNWDRVRGQHTQVTVHLIKGGVPITVTRAQAPNKIILDVDGRVTTATQAEVDAVLGLSLDEFLLQGLTSQFGKFFLDFGETRRLEIFSSALSLDSWEAAASQAGASLGLLETEIQDVRTIIERTRGRLDGAEDAVQDAIDGYKKARADAKHASKESIDPARCESELAAAQIELKRARVESDAAGVRLRALLDDRLMLEKKEVRAVAERARTSSRELARVERDLEVIDDRLRDILEKSECPTCEQSIGPKHRRRLRASAEDARSEAQAKLNRVREDYADAQAVGEALNTRISKLNDRISKVREEKEGIEATLQAETTRANTARDALARVRAIGKIHKERVESAREVVRTAKARIDSLTQEIEDHEHLEAGLLLKRGPLEFWKRGFKELRLWLVSAALDELTLASNNALEELGLVGWKVVFEAERETQQRTISRGFHAFICSPASPDRVPWESWSGGETQRLQLAVAVGVNDLISARTGVGSSIEMYDEPTRHLSADGVQDVITFLSERARTSGRSVWVVDHNHFAHGSFTRRYLVTKSAAGSVISTVDESPGE